MSSLSSNPASTTAHSEEMNSIREEASEHGIEETKLEELLEVWFLEYLEPPTSFGELIHGVFC